jgi:sugar phosphate isomerase/epimerase
MLSPVLAGSVDEVQNKFFAFDNGVGRGKLTPQKQAEILKELGYDGIGYTGIKNLSQRIKVFRKHNLKIFSLYVHCNPQKQPAYDPGFENALKQLKGTGTMLWLTVQGKADEQCAIDVVREMGDIAGKYDVKIALYPHYGYYVAIAADAIRLVKIIDRKNVGLSINLCHELRSGKGDELEDIINQAGRKLFLVSINGADHEGNWDRLIQPLGQGEFDVASFISKLKKAGYTGPVGLQCYNVKGDQETNLKASIQAWKKYSTNNKRNK